MPPSFRPNMGATPYEQGVTFRVWAPFARAVAVAGTFNGWSTTAHSLFSEGNGYWSVDVPGASVRDEYKFVISSAHTGTMLWKNDPYAREVTNSRGNSVIADPDYSWGALGYRTPSWNEMIIYELHVGTFVADPNHPGGRGTFASAMTRLDHLRDLGINAIQVMPADEFAGDISWGYNPAYLFAIESAYGGPNGFRRFVDAAHARGIAVLFDVVYNHFGPSDLDVGLWQFDGWNQEGHGGIYFYNDRRRVTWWGETRPDYGRGEVRQFLRDNALRWLEQRQVDGLRWDATNMIRNVSGRNDGWEDIPEGWSLMQWINNEIDARQPWKISIAEDMQNNEWLTRRVGAGGAGFDAQWDALFVHAVRDAVITGDDASRSMNAVRDAIAHRYNGDAFQRVVYTESHDEVANGKARVPEEVWPGNAGSYFSRKRSMLGAALVFAAPGIPMIFQGQEFLEDRYFNDAWMLDWTKASRNSGVLAFYRDLIRLRRNWYDTTRGLRGQGLNVYHVNDGDKLIAFHRWEAGGPRDDVIVVANLANRGYGSYTIGMPRSGFWRVRLNSDWQGYSQDFGNWLGYDTVSGDGGKDGMPFSANLGIGPYSVLILSQD